MALLATLAGLSANYRPLARSVIALMLADNRANFATWPTISAGTGVPSSAEPDGSVYVRVNGASSCVYQRISSAWTIVAGTGALGTPADGSVTTAKLADLAVTAAKIANATITNAQIAAGTIRTNEILDGTILGGDIANQAITATQIANNTITNAQIAAGTIRTNEILDGTIIGTDMANGAVGTTQLANNAVDNTKLAAGSVRANNEDITTAIPALTPAAEGSPTANAIAIAVQMKDRSGGNVGRVQRFKCTIYDNNGLPALTAAFTATKAGAPGTAQSTDAKASVFYDTDNTGAITVSVADISGVFVGSVWVHFEGVYTGSGAMQPCESSAVKITFA